MINELVELKCNVDDMTGEEISFAMDMLFSAGALDVYTFPVGMKKSRTGTLISVTCKKEDKEAMIGAIFKYTTTIGVKEYSVIGHAMEREIEEVETLLGTVRKKTSRGYGTERVKYEFDDVSRIARENGISFGEALEAIKTEKHE